MLVFHYFSSPSHSLFIFFFNDTATTEIYTLSLHDALPILAPEAPVVKLHPPPAGSAQLAGLARQDRKSTRRNSSHGSTSHADFCLKKKKISAQHPVHLSMRFACFGWVSVNYPG